MKRGRVFLVDWDGDGAAERVAALEADGWTVAVESLDGALAIKHMRDDPPDVIAVDLSRLPSHGRETARAARQTPALRDVPIVLFGGSSEARTRAAGLVPGAIIVDADDLLPTLARALMRPARD